MASLLSLHLPRPNPHHLIRASSSSSPITTSTTTTNTTTTTTIQDSPQSLEERFGRKGVKFTESGGVPTVELSVRNGSSVSLRIPDGHVTSYKPKVYWKEDGFEEVLHTIPSGLDSGCPLKGGLSLVLNVSKDGSPWQASQWIVKDSESDSIDAVQVELSCSNGDGSLEITYVISLYLLCMATAVIVKNKGNDTIKLTSAMLSHLKFKSQRGAAVQGLRGCSYCSHPPLSSVFGILSPAEAMEQEPPGWPFFNNNNGNEEKEGSWIVEDNLYTILRGKLSRVYTAPPMDRMKRIYNTPPSKFETIDQGSGLGFRLIRIGYEDFYICSPGSFSKKYGKDYFICTGPASMLVPVVLNPGEEWRGAQVIEHDNL